MGATRVAQVRGVVAEKELDALLISGRSDVAWLSGFRGSNGVLLLSADQQILLTDFRYRTQAGTQAAGWAYTEQPSGQPLTTAIAQTIEAAGFHKVGFQPDQLLHHQWEHLRRELGWNEHRLVGVGGAIEAFRAVKDVVELAAIRAAARIADATVQHAYELVRPGLTERQVKAELEYFMVQQGATKASFDLIIASGSNSAMPHATVTDRVITTGDLVTIDLGCVWDGYCSDITRTFAVGAASAAQRAMYEVVYTAQAAALAALGPGRKGREVDQVARDLITAAGHGDHFGHGLGHGVGLDVHESPRLSPAGEQELQPGHVVTIEPGVYVPEVGGVRIEDLTLVTADGHELLSHAPKPAELLVVG